MILGCNPSGPVVCLQIESQCCDFSKTLSSKYTLMLLLLLSHYSRVRLCVTPWTAAYQASPSMGFSGKNTGVGCHFLLTLGDPN